MVDDLPAKNEINSQTKVITPETTQSKPTVTKPVTPAPKQSQTEAQNQTQTVTTTAAEITFRVQFLLSPKEIALNDNRFKGIEQLWMYKDGNYFKYTAGSSADFDSIMKIREKMLHKYPDAFVVAFKNDKRISVNEARKLLNIK